MRKNNRHMAALAVLLVLALVSVSAGDSLLRDTAFGPVSGTTEGDALVWFSIPYGKAPVGELRWKAPEDPEAWTEVYDASERKPIAMQLSGGKITGTEDCLNLDIYTPQEGENLPVLVYIHGGNNQTGHTRELIGAEFAARNDVVFVSLNYRLGLLGFNCLPALQTDPEATGNYALLDIAKALDWIKDNIASFGGDPENITVSGFSAGGRDVMALLISPLFEGKFQKAISFSGGMTTADETLSARKIAKALAPIAVEDGVAETEEEAVEWLLQDTEEVRDYLYSLPAESLCSLMGSAGIRMSVFPHLYADGVSLPAEGFETESYNSVPLIMLTGTTEFSMFASGASNYAAPEMQALSADELAAVKAFAITYGSKMYQYFNAESSAERMHSSYDAPIYLCSINYGDTSSDYKVSPLGAFHGIFIPLLAVNNTYAGMHDFTNPVYSALADDFNQYLRNFLYTGNPNDEALAEWAEWEPETHLSLFIDGVDGEPYIESVSVTTSYDEIMDEMDADTSLSDEAKLMAIRNVMNGRWFSAALDERYGNRDLWQ